MKHSNQDSVPKSSAESSSTTLLGKATRLAAAGKYEEALSALSGENSAASDIKNARAVCLMRLGRHDAALQILRSLVLQSGSTWMKPELPIVYRVNFATALLLAKLPGGVRDALFDIQEKDHPSVVRLHNALDVWQKRLTWWQRLNWKLGVAPEVPISIDFEPGDFIDPLSVVVTTPPQPAKTAFADQHHVA